MSEVLRWLAKEIEAAEADPVMHYPRAHLTPRLERRCALLYARVTALRQVQERIESEMRK